MHGQQLCNNQRSVHGYLLDLSRDGRDIYIRADVYSSRQMGTNGADTLGIHLSTNCSTAEYHYQPHRLRVLRTVPGQDPVRRRPEGYYRVTINSLTPREAHVSLEWIASPLNSHR